MKANEKGQRQDESTHIWRLRDVGVDRLECQLLLLVILDRNNDPTARAAVNEKRRKRRWVHSKMTAKMTANGDVVISLHPQPQFQFLLLFFIYLFSLKSQPNSIIIRMDVIECGGCIE